MIYNKHMKKIYTGKNVVITGTAQIKNNCSIWHNAVIRADSDTITIDENTNVQDLTMIHTGFDHAPVHIGKNVTIGHSAIIHGCTIDDNCLIGMGAIIMNHAHIRENSIVGAGALVTENKEFPPNSLILGSPAKQIRLCSEEEIANIKKNASLYIQEAKKELKETEKNDEEIISC